MAASSGMKPVPWLLPLSWGYRFGVAVRNLGYELGWRRVVELPVPVVSVGNLAAGGTGKTQFVLWLVEHARAAGLRVGVLARGYGRRPGEPLNDEGRLLARRFPDLPQQQDPDRHAAGHRLLAETAVDLLVLDDGFQHRRLRRNLDVCCLDARDPLCSGRLLPAGWLREPLSGLERADVVLLTGAQGMAESELAASFDRVRELIQARPCFACATRAIDLVEFPGAHSHELGELSGQRVALLAGIARPGRFEATVAGLGAQIERREFLGDHTPIPEPLLARMSAAATAASAWLVMTEKDDARLALPAEAGPRRFVLRVGLEFVGQTAPLSAFLPPNLAVPGTPEAG